ncbi:MAG TPA: hypothetical protein VFD10_06990 [Atribacterota bacterium]|nr:hypothetical protein [Atribacterota bacterium]
MINNQGSEILMGYAKSHEKKHKKESKEKKVTGLEKELNIRYHAVNLEWNYTISPRSMESTKQVQK